MTPSRCSSPRRAPLSWAAIALVSAFAALPAAAQAPAPASSLAGVWNYEAAKSDSAQQKMEAMRPQGGGGGRRGGGGWGGGMGGGGGRRGGGGWGGAGGGGMGGGGGRPPRGPGDESSGDRGGARGPEMRLIMKPPTSMLVEQTDSTIVLYEQGLPIEVLVLGAPQNRADAVDKEAPHVPASWSGARLTAIREDERGGRATQTFAIAADGKSFTLTLRREPRDDRPALEIRREYRREDAN